MMLNKCPEAFWDFALEYIITIRQFLVRRSAEDRSPMETVTGETMDISEFIDFDFYQFVKYRDAKYDRDEPVQLGRWLGIAHDIGTPMTYWILKQLDPYSKKNGVVKPRKRLDPVYQHQYREVW
jgi:hypothetical protein